MLLDPLEEQLNLPPTPVQLGDGQWRKFHVIGEKHQFLVALRVAVTDSAQKLRVAVLGVGAGQSDPLVTDQAGGAVHRVRVDTLALGVLFGAQHKVAADHVHDLKAGEIQVGAVHDVERTAFGDQPVQYVHVVQFAI